MVIGSGPGGYVAAIRASQLKMRVAVIEREQPGGVCLNWGCIPSKALLNSAETMESIRGAAKEHGIEVGEVKRRLQTRDRAQPRGRRQALQGRALPAAQEQDRSISRPSASVTGPNTVALAQAPGKPSPPRRPIEAERILIATGSGERLFPGMKLGDGVMTSREALLIYDHLPESIVIIGAGAIGAEFGYFYQAFGAKVTIVELEKADAARLRRRDRRGIAPLVRQARGHGDARPRLQVDGAEGRRMDRRRSTPRQQQNRSTPRPCWSRSAVSPLSPNLGLEKLGVEVDRGGFIKIDDSFRTTCPSIYAIGDVLASSAARP